MGVGGKGTVRRDRGTAQSVVVVVVVVVVVLLLVVTSLSPVERGEESGGDVSIMSTQCGCSDVAHVLSAWGLRREDRVEQNTPPCLPFSIHSSSPTPFFFFLLLNAREPEEGVLVPRSLRCTLVMVSM